ncbi:MAG: hypothetical protein RIC55_36230 [Pirellulaceae bacterium]
MATTKTTKKTTTSAKAAKAKATRDRFGSREGTESATINATITNKPQTVAAIAEKTGLSASRVRNHMKWLMDREHITKTDDGYKTKATTKGRSRKTTK